MAIDRATYLEWKDQPILAEEDEWDGEYQTYGEMWEGEGFMAESEPIQFDPVF